MERADAIEIDPAKVRAKDTEDKARRIAGTFITDSDSEWEKSRSELDKLTDKKSAAEGVKKAILSNVFLPRDESYPALLEKLATLSSWINPGSMALYAQLSSFYKQYLDAQLDLTNRMKQSYAPALEQKKAQLRAQYGADIDIRPEDDQEFIKLLDKNLRNLEAQYSQVLDNAKEQLSAILS